MSYWERYEIRQSIVCGKIHVDVIFWRNGSKSPSPFVTTGLDPWESYVGAPNIIERWFGITWEKKLEKAISKAHREAQKRLDRSEKAYRQAEAIMLSYRN